MAKNDIQMLLLLLLLLTSVARWLRFFRVKKQGRRLKFGMVETAITFGLLLALLVVTFTMD